MKMKPSFQRREMLLFLTTNMAAVTSRANQQWYSADQNTSTKLLFIHSKCFINCIIFVPLNGALDTWTISLPLQRAFYMSAVVSS